MIGIAVILLIGVGIGIVLERKKETPIVIEVKDKLKSWFKKEG